MTPNIDVVIEPGPALLPFGKDIGFNWQWLQSWPVQRLEQ